MFSRLFIYSLLVFLLASCAKHRIRHHACDCDPVNERFEGGYIFMPNAFTPSGDGQNDMLKIFASGITNYRLIIRDRAGIKIFDSDNREREWYGENAKGSRKVRSDNYAYLLEYTTVAGKNYTRKGKVSLINNEELSDFLAEHCIENYNDCVFGQMWQGDTLPLKPLSLAGEYFPECN